ncbi:MAG: cadmium-translocating P-type ATPase [Succinivibrio sp.]|nr:cadmium-translocating P-type ATPase [Succinivibrio sp.]
MLSQLNLRQKFELGYALVLMLILIYLRYVTSFEAPLILLMLTLSAYLPLALPLLRVAFKTLWQRHRLNEQFLMMLATVGAFGLEDYPEALAVLIFYRIGELFEGYAQGRAHTEITALIRLKPSFARLLKDDGSEELVKPRKVRIGQLIRVQAGEGIPLDGILQSKQAVLDCSALTGESAPVLVKEGEEVLSGSINTSSLIELKVSTDYKNSSITRLINLIEDAAANKSKPEALISRFAGWYTPLVVGVALLLALVPLCVPGQSAADWISRSLVFLIVSCPCALVLSVPLSFFGGLGALSKLGVMVKGSVYLERLAKLKLMCFDKTGTLTSGRFRVTKVEALEDEHRLVKCLYALEAHSSHPLAQAVCAYAKAQGLEPVPVEDLEESAGYGLCARIEGQQVYAGRREYLNASLNLRLEPEDGEGTLIYVACNGAYAGRLCLSDEPKEEAKEMLSKLAGLEVRSCMITGDKKMPALHAAEELGLAEVLYEQLPEDKLLNFKRLKADRGLTGFVGDGINDAPVLASADVGIAMGQFGSQAACEAADVVIMNDDLSKIPVSIEVSRRTYHLALENVYLSLGVKFIILLLGALGLANIWLAIFGDVGVLVLAVLNAMRSLGFVRVSRAKSTEQTFTEARA